MKVASPATLQKIILLLTIAAVLLPRALPFSAQKSGVHHVASRQTSITRSRGSARPSAVQLNLVMDPNDILTTAGISQQWISNGALDALASSSSLLSFTDQGQNLAGTLFQASLLPYLLFLYFLSFRANRISGMANFGFQFVLLFVLSTIPSGIITKSVYGQSLANTDWLHGSAELLLTIANVFIVLGFTQAMTNPKPPEKSLSRARTVGFATFGAFVLTAAAGTSLGLGGHLPFLFGLGNLPTEWVQSFSFVTHAEPINALSIPTWAIHFSSVFEYLFAMNLIWDYAESTKNSSWKGLTWGMLPLHASGICACTYHFFYNPSELQFLVTSQAGLTLIGNITCMIAAFRIAVTNGWTVDELNPWPRSATSPQGLVADGIAAQPLAVVEPKESNEALATKIVVLTLLTSYIVKYGELGLDLPFTPNAAVATLMILGIPGITAYNFYNRSEGKAGFSLPTFGSSKNGPSLSMAEVKKYGVAGTVAYVLTELAFWIVAFPAAAYALYQSTGHWPDLLHDNTDRAAVLGFIFAGANIARAFVPVRLGAALALAPWVDENLLSGKGQKDAAEEVVKP